MGCEVCSERPAVIEAGVWWHKITGDQLGTARVCRDCDPRDKFAGRVKSRGHDAFDRPRNAPVPDVPSVYLRADLVSVLPPHLLPA